MNEVVSIASGTKIKDARRIFRYNSVFDYKKYFWLRHRVLNFINDMSDEDEKTLTSDVIAYFRFSKNPATWNQVYTFFENNYRHDFKQIFEVGYKSLKHTAKLVKPKMKEDLGELLYKYKVGDKGTILCSAYCKRHKILSNDIISILESLERNQKFETCIFNTEYENPKSLILRLSDNVFKVLHDLANAHPDDEFYTDLINFICLLFNKVSLHRVINYKKAIFTYNKLMNAVDKKKKKKKKKNNDDWGGMLDDEFEPGFSHSGLASSLYALSKY